MAGSQSPLVPLAHHTAALISHSRAIKITIGQPGAWENYASDEPVLGRDRANGTRIWEHGGIVTKTVSRTVFMSRRVSDDVLGVLGDPNDAQVLPGSGAKMKLRQNALTLR